MNAIDQLPSIKMLSVEDQQACKRVVVFASPGGGLFRSLGSAGIEGGTPTKPQVKLPKSPDDCWVWIGSICDGRPMKSHNGRDMLGHRWLWSQLFGPITPGYVLAHTCGNDQCVSPHHCKVMTQGRAAELCT